jgi:predicted RNase H-like HicB family nuclease
MSSAETEQHQRRQPGAPLGAKMSSARSASMGCGLHYDENVARTKTRRRKNPETAVIAAEYPVKAWIFPDTGATFETNTVRLDNGRYLAVMVGYEDIRHTASTRQEAERGLIRKIEQAKRNPSTLAVPKKQKSQVVRLGPITARIEWDGQTQTYASWSPELGVASCGDSPEEALEMLKEAIRGHLSVAREFGKRIRISSAQQRELEKLIA